MIGLSSIALGQEVSVGADTGAGASTRSGIGAAPARGPRDQDQEQDQNRLGLADLAAYRAALAGRATGDRARSSDPPVQVGFRELWNSPEVYRGRRVTVRGRVERTFRQGAVGSFPPLVEGWVFTSSGDPLCVVYPRSGEGETDREAGAGTKAARGAAHALDDRAAGQSVEFTGTFLKMVRYAAGDGDRLAPLIVGDHPPALVATAASAEDRSARAAGRDNVLRAVGGELAGQNGARLGWSRSSWILGLTMAAVAVAIIAAQHLRGAGLRDRAAAKARGGARATPDLPLEFIEPPDGPGPAGEQPGASSRSGFRA